MTRAALCVGAALIAAGARTVRAQEPPPGRLELGAGLGWMGSASAGSSDASESTPSGGLSPIFKTSSTLKSASGLRAHAAFRVTRWIEVEARASYTKPTLETSVSGDIENATPVTAGETVTQYVIGAGALWYVPLKRMPDRWRPFVAGHAAYLRQLHEAGTLAVTGRSYEIGGGIKYIVPVRRKSRVRGLGLRGDVGVAARTKGVFFESGARFSPVAAAAVFVRF